MTNSEKMPESTNSLDQQVHRRWIAELRLAVVTERIKDWRPRCPMHNMPDCSPLLNGCNIPNNLYNEVREFLD